MLAGSSASSHSSASSISGPAAFADIASSGLSPAAVANAIDQHSTHSIPRLRLLWTYYRNPIVPRGANIADSASSFRAWRTAQERSLPPRLLGDTRPTGDDRARARKEIVIENDIAWRVHAMVDFMFAQRVRISSTAADPALRDTIDRVLDSVWEASGGVALMQDMALLANIYGSVDLIVRADALASLPQHTAQDATPPGGPAAPLTSANVDAPSPALDTTRPEVGVDGIVSAARRGVRVEMIEPTRGVALLFPDDYRRLSAYVLRYRRSAQDTSGVRVGREGGGGGGGGGERAEGPASARPPLWRRVLAGLGAPDAPPPVDADVTITEIIGPRVTHTYERRPDGTHRLVSITPSLVSRERHDDQPPVVHIQNLSQPFRYEGLSEVEPLIPLQDELNIRLSDRANRVTMQSFRMFLAKGIDGALELPIAPNTVWSTDNPDAQITPFGGDVDAPSEQEHIEQIREAMDKQSGVPPLASGVVRAKIGNLSSENALRVTLMGLLSKTARKRVGFSQGIARASRLILEALDHAGILATTEADRDIRVDWPDPLPRDERQVLDAALKKIELGVPREVVLSELGYAGVDPGIE